MRTCPNNPPCNDTGQCWTFEQVYVMCVLDHEKLMSDSKWKGWSNTHWKEIWNGTDAIDDVRCTARNVQMEVMEEPK